ncbi:hypothetical protein UFOVP32_74 [uncultured Caudovirales phage]|uniref:Uncharacterized protein n=1 Tax=uncultured Caudovirales phage TaxID=2100421 RepID=A0A6J5KQF5_9CAUD|nr:hypothetical protein UFOVP32_74 [uncultured Caudovirales phage]CAB4123526.1 hypothetical protein UFOVP50_2 [uncultured Caudovirales phage]
MATYYWVGGNGAWTDTSMWANQSGGVGGTGAVPTNIDDAIFDKAATYTVTGNLAALNLTVSAGLVTFNVVTVNIGSAGAGSLTFGTGNVAAFTFTTSFNFQTSSTLTIDTKGVPLFGSGISVTFGVSGRTGTISLLSDLKITGGAGATSGKVALNYGSLDLNNFQLTTDGPFFINNAVVHTLAFGTNGTGNITVTGVDTNVVAFSLAGTNTITGVPIVNISYSNTIAQTVNVYVQAATEANSISFNFTTGTYTLNFLSTASYTARSVSFAGFAGTWATRSTANTIYGDLTLSSQSGFSVAASTGVLTLGSTNATTRVITSYGKTLDVPITIGASNSNGSFQLADALTMGASKTLTFSFGTLNLNNQTLTAGFFSSSSTNGRVLAFGSSGRIRLIGAGGTLWNTGIITNLTTSGTSDVTIDNNSAVATTITPASLSETYALNFNIISGNYTLTVTNTAAFKNLNFVANPSVATTGFVGSIASHTADISIYGNLTLSSSMSPTLSSSPGFIFKATSGTQILTSNGRTFDSPMAQNGVGGTLQLADAFAMGATRTFNFNNGTFDGNGQTITGALALSASATGVTAFKGLNTSIVFNHTDSTMTLVGNNTTGKITTINGSINLNGYTWTATGFGTNVGTKSLTFNGGTLLLTGPYAPTFDNANPTGFTTVAGTGTGYIRMNAASAKTFSGGGSIFNCILSNDGAGALTITGFNTFLGITNGVSPTAFVFPAGVSANITKVSNFSINGASSTSLVTITSSTSGSPATLSMASGTVSANYLSLKDSAATGGAAWSAYNSTSVSGNSGWSFSNIAATANFFLVF